MFVHFNHLRNISTKSEPSTLSNNWIIVQNLFILLKTRATKSHIQNGYNKTVIWLNTMDSDSSMI